jgi:hypothetical protein
MARTRQAASNSIQIHTRATKKGVDYRKDYIKSGRLYSENLPNAEIYKKFFEGKDVLLPPGTYKIAAAGFINRAPMFLDVCGVPKIRLGSLHFITK